MKDRADFQVLTFNIDEEPGMVEPAMKEKGFTFPVLPAFSFVTTLLDGDAIPENWGVDREECRWTQIGFSPDPDWAKTVIERLESVKKFD